MLHEGNDANWVFVDVPHTAVTYCEAEGLVHCEHPTSAHALHAAVTYCPPGHDVLHGVEHAVALLFVVEYVPGAHGVQLVAPSESEYVPIGQAVQLDAPMTDEEVPVGHRVHAVAPACEYVPGGHAISTPSDA